VREVGGGLDGRKHAFQTGWGSESAHDLLKPPKKLGEAASLAATSW
jgi:hypothetical protein